VLPSNKAIILAPLITQLVTDNKTLGDIVKDYTASSDDTTEAIKIWKNAESTRVGRDKILQASVIALREPMVFIFLA
jgi:hypothetical protein